MTSPKHIQDELQQLESSLPLNQAPAFTVPPGYFEGFAASVLARLKELNQLPADELAGLSPLLAGLAKKNVLSVPEGYFSQLAPVVESEESSLLAGISHTMPNTVPAGYFENLSSTILRQVAPQEAKVVSFNRKRWMQMAAAAVVAGIMAVSGFVYFSSKSNSTNVQSTAWMEKGLKNVSNETLDKFIQATDAVHSNDVAMNEVHSTEVRTMLTDVSDKEMDAFLAQVPTDDEELLIIN